MKDLYELPDDLPVPVDDGACAHLAGTCIPSLALAGASGGTVDLGACKGVVVVFVYPMNGRPDGPPMTGWNEIPGARGCTPQSCSFRDHAGHIERLGAQLFGLSAQPLEEQREARERLHIPFELLNDSEFRLARAMRLPTFEYLSSKFLKRFTMIARDGLIEELFYPVFPPDRNAGDVVQWLEHNPV